MKLSNLFKPFAGPSIIPGVPKWLIVIPGVLAVIGGLVYLYGELKYKPDFQTGEDSLPPARVFVRLYSDGNCEGKIVRGADADNFFVAGTFTNNISTDEKTKTTSRGGTDIFVAKVNNRGYVEWLQTFGGLENDQPTDIAVDAEGNALVTLNYSNQFQIGGVGLAVATGKKLSLLLKLTSAGGQIVWHNYAATTNQPGNILINDVDVDANGNIAVAGTLNIANAIFSSQDNTTTPLSAPTGTTPVFLAQYTAAGNITSVNIIASGTLYTPHLCYNKKAPGIFTSFTFDATATLGATPLGAANGLSQIGYACFQLNGQLIPGSAHASVPNNLGSPQFSTRPQNLAGTVLQDTSGNFFLSGHYENEIQFGSFQEKDAQISGILLKINPQNFEVNDLRSVGGNVTQMQDAGIGAGNQLLFGSSGYRELVIYSTTAGADEVYNNRKPNDPASDEVVPFSFICNYSTAFAKNSVQIVQQKYSELNSSNAASVGSNANKIALTGSILGEASWLSPEEKVNFPAEIGRSNFLMVITDY